MFESIAAMTEPDTGFKTSNCISVTNGIVADCERLFDDFLDIARLADALNLGDTRRTLQRFEPEMKHLRLV